MTPSALTPAARVTTKKRPPERAARASGARTAASAGPARSATGAAATRGDGHRGEVRRSASPRATRRVSGPVGGVSRGGAAALQPAFAPAPRPARTRPRPVKPRISAPRSPATWPARSAAYVRALPDHALLDRIVRGRAWIPLLGVLLAGIVAMQVEVLKLNAGIGRSLERGTALSAENQLLRANVAQLSDAQRIERLAAGWGLQMPDPAQVKFLNTGPAAVQRALGSIHQPDASTFNNQLAAESAQILAADPTAASAAATNTAATTGAIVTPSTAGATTTSTTGTSATGTASGAGDTGTSASTTDTTTGGGATSSDVGSATTSGVPAGTSTDTGATSQVTPAAAATGGTGGGTTGTSQSGTSSTSSDAGGASIGG
jgi:hypothetical protein